jgi:hypothetical protein
VLIVWLGTGFSETSTKHYSTHIDETEGCLQCKLATSFRGMLQ